MKNVSFSIYIDKKKLVKLDKKFKKKPPYDMVREKRERQYVKTFFYMSKLSCFL